jgi:hypothetical protein
MFFSKKHPFSHRSSLPFLPNRTTMVLSDDISSNGRNELVLSSMNGDVFLLRTEIPYHPLNTWTR